MNIRCHRSSSWPLRVNGSCLHLKITAHQMVRASPRQPSCGGEAAVGSGAPTQLDRNGIVSSNKKLSDSSTSRNKHWVTAGGGRGGTFDQVSREESSRLGSTQGWALLSDSPPPLHRAAPSLPNTEGFCSHSHLEPLHSSLLLPCSRPWCPNVPHSQTRRSLDALNAFQFSLVHVRGLLNKHILFSLSSFFWNCCVNRGNCLNGIKNQSFNLRVLSFIVGLLFF